MTTAQLELLRVISKPDDPRHSAWLGVDRTPIHHAALRAARVVKIDWQAGPGADVSEADLLQRGAELLAGDTGSLVVDNERGSRVRSG